MFGTDFADVDNDGDLDLGSLSFGCCAGVHIYLNHSDGTWTQSFGILGGNASSRALILLDGVPMSDPFFGYIPFSALAPERLESVRVTRGGGSGPFGSGALSGTIELESAGTRSLTRS